MNLSKENMKVGLALGSGSAKGFAHIGILKALEEEKFPIDRIAGCSAGAVVGGIYATGTNLDLLAKIGCQLNVKEYVDVVIPRKGFVRGEKLHELIRVLTKDLCFEDCKIPFACVATDICKGELKVFDSGKLHHAIRASMSIPGIFEPYWVDGVMYVDGAVMDAVPAGTCKAMGADFVIAVNLGIKPAYQEVPERTMNIFMRSMDLIGYHANVHKIKHADIVLNPDVSSLGRYTNANGMQIVECGYDLMRKMLPKVYEKMEKRLEKMEKQRAITQA